MPLVSAGTAALFGSLPDWVEPPIHPNHRQFGHSVLVFIALVYGLKELYEWQAIEGREKFFRRLGLIVGGAYVAHLAMDAMTAKSIPLIGNIR